MAVPFMGWSQESWGAAREPFQRLCEMVGYDRIPGVDDLYRLIGATMSAKLFAESIGPFVAKTGKTQEQVREYVRQIERELNLLGALPFMSLQEGVVDPASFEGVALLTTGTANYIEARLQQLMTYVQAGARIVRVICLASSRVCEGPADLKHPIIAGWEGLKPTEAEFQRHLVQTSELDRTLDVRYANLPRQNDDKRPLSLQQQLEHLMESGQRVDFILANLYVPVNFNALYVALHTADVLGLTNVWFSQNGGALVDALPTYWAPALQHTLTWPNGAFRLLKELVGAGLIQEG